MANSLKKLSEQIASLPKAHGDLHGAVSRVGKNIDRRIASNLSGLFRNQHRLEYDKETCEIVCVIIAKYLARAEYLPEAMLLCKEAQLDDLQAELIRNHEGIQGVVNAMRAGDISAVGEWIELNWPEEKQLQVDIHKLHLAQLVMQGHRLEAIHFARQKLASEIENSEELGKIMTALFASENTDIFKAVFSQARAAELEARIAGVLQRANTGLGTLLSVGVRALPSLLNLRTMMGPRKEFIFSSDEMPIEIPLPKRSHSQFACPVLRQQTSEENPAMRLGCGHVVSKEAMLKLPHPMESTIGPTKFKCPYCPIISGLAEVRQVHF